MNEDDEDVDGQAIQAAYDFIMVVLEVDPEVYGEIAAPVLEILKQQLSAERK